MAIAIAAFAAAGGIVSNWFTRPAKLTTRRLVAILVVVVSAGVLLGSLKESLDNESTPKSSNQQPRASSTTSMPSTTELPPPSRLILSWVSDINRTCAPISSKLREEKSRYESLNSSESVEASIASIRNARNSIGPLVRDLNRVELPSDAQEREKARDWLQAYSDLYSKLVAVIAKMEDATSGGLFQELISRPGVKSAYQDVMDAAINAKGKGDVLGIECPASNVTG